MSDLAAMLAKALGADAILNLARLSGGASRETWAFDATYADGRVERLILRRDHDGAAPISDGALGRETERLVIEAVGPPAPPVRAAVANGFVMTQLEGETNPRPILRDAAFLPARAAFAGDAARALAAIHRTPLRKLPPLPVLEAGAQIALYRASLDRVGERRPALEYGLRWLERRLPPPVEPVLVHGDFRMGNLLIGHRGLVAALDWELAHLGDPMEDLGWLAVRSWRFGGRHPVGGVATREALLDAYAATGLAVDAERACFWETFGTVKWGVICLTQAFKHLSGRESSVELAAIGRRTSEAEYDLLELIA